MTNPTPQDREMAQAEASQLAITICPCANRDQHRRDVAALLEYAETARLQGRREALEEAARVAEATKAEFVQVLQRIADAPMIDHSDPENSSRQIALAAIRKLGEA